MTFLELQDYVKSDRFDESQRGDIKRWINYRYARLWGKEPWTFKLSVASYTLTAGTSSVDRGSFRRVLAVWDDTISPLYRDVDAVSPQEFYGGATRTSGIPIAFTMIGENIHFDAPALSARTYTVLGELEFTELTADGDIPLIPSEFHPVLAHAAIAEGLRRENDPTWQASEEDYRAGVEDMKGVYLTPIRTFGGSYPSWPAWG